MHLSQKELLHERLQEQGRVIRALDGLQPDVGHEVLRVILEVLSGEALLLRALLSSAQEDLVVMLGEENDTLPESVEVGGITSDGQLSLPRAVANVFADVPLSLFVRSRPADLRGRSSRKKS